MKKFILLFLTFIPLLSMGQATEAQKQEALSAASKFCSLLAQFSNGGVTYLGNDQKIFELCSTPQMSTFDDISSQKEMQLSAYLALITKKYKNHLKMTFSTPQLNEAYALPKIQLATRYASTSGDMGNVGLDFDRIGYADIYIVFNIEQKIGTLNKITSRQLVYSVIEKKILSFSVGNSPFILLCKALDLYKEKKYTQALECCDKAIANDRFDKKSICATLGIMCCTQISDYDKIYKYTPYIENQRNNYEHFAEVMKALSKEDIEMAIKHLLILAESDFPTRYDAQALLGYFYSRREEKDLTKALYWYRKAIKEGSAIAGYWLFLDCMANDDFDELNFEDEEITNAITTSAKRGFIPAFYEVALIESHFYHDTEKEGEWYKKGAEMGDLMGMIYYGCWLSATKHNKQEALYWLRKVNNAPNLGTYLKDYSFKTQGMKTVEDIQKLVYNVEHDIPVRSPSTPINESNSSSTSSHSNTSSTHRPNANSSATYTPSTNTSSHSSTTSAYKPRKYRKPFNCPDDEHAVAGLSVGYVQKQWTVKEDGETYKVGFWDDTKQLSGIQAGLRIEPLFKYGFGIDTGLYYEYYYSKSKSQTYDGVEFQPTMNEHSLYLPIHLEYRLNFSSKFQVFFYGGIGLDYVLSAKVKTNNDELSYDEDDAYKLNDLKKFNSSLEYGGGFRVSCLQFNFSMVNGLLNMYKGPNAEIKQNKNLMCSLSLMF